MIVRDGLITDLERVVKIYNDAILKFENDGTFQWGKGYPNANNYIEDIKNHIVRVLEIDGLVVGTITLVFGEDENYKEIDGAWLNDEDYLVIHRIAIDKDYYKRGIGLALFKDAIEVAKKRKTRNIRIDTLKYNYDMKRLIEKFDFKYCGVITLKRNGGLRDAFHKIIE